MIQSTKEQNEVGEWIGELKAPCAPSPDKKHWTWAALRFRATRRDVAVNRALPFFSAVAFTQELIEPQASEKPPYGSRFGMWDLTNGSFLWDKANGYEIGIAASADCRLVVRGTGYQVDNLGPYVETAVELYDGTSGELLSLGRHRRPPTAVAFTSETSILAGGAEGRCSQVRRS